VSDLFDLLVPIHMPMEAGFVGPSPRQHFRFNGEVGFSFDKWPASFHESGKHRYLIIRIGKPQREIENLLPGIRGTIAAAAAVLDISIRPSSREVVLTSGASADINNISLFPHGTMPHIEYHDGATNVFLPAEALTEATSIDESRPRAPEQALRVFADVDFEATATSRFILLSTILELLAARQPRDKSALAMMKRWEAEAKEAARPDVAEAVRTIFSESIGSAIARLVREAAIAADCTEEMQDSFEDQARQAYRRRGALLHRAAPVTTDELASLRAVVRLVLVGKTTGTGFSPVGNRQLD